MTLDHMLNYGDNGYDGHEQLRLQRLEEARRAKATPKPGPPTHPLPFADRKLKEGWRFKYSDGFVWIEHPQGGKADVLKLDKYGLQEFHGDEMETTGEAIAAMLNGEWVPKTKGE